MRFLKPDRAGSTFFSQMNEVAQERAEIIVSEDNFQGGDQAFGENLLITNSRIVSYIEIT